MAQHDSVADVHGTYDDMCTNGTGAQCRSYFVVLSIHSYAMHVIFDDYKRRCFMFMDHVPRCSTSGCQANDAARSRALFSQESFIIGKFGFPTPDGVPTELEEAISLWMSPDILAR
jgi:hypothetical protein